MRENQMSLTVSGVIFLLVVGGFVYITMNKDKMSGEESQTMEENYMTNVQQVEGVKMTTLKDGEGDMAKSGDTVAVNYTGTLLDGTVFDSNIDEKFGHIEPLVFTIGSGQVIRGWDIGIEGMMVGEKRMLEIESDYAYGPNQYGPIPPNATLVFEVELLEIR